MVGTEAVALAEMSDLEGCKDAKGNAIGIPNLAGIAFGAQQQCSPATYTLFGNNDTFCATRNDPEQTYTVPVGDAKFYLSLDPNLHGIWVYNSDLPTAKAAQVPTYTGAVDQGIKKDGDGFYASSGSAPQSALTPLVGVIKRSGSTFVSGGSTAPNLVLLRKEAELQGVDTVKVWVCAAGCYVPYFIQTGGSSVEGTYQNLTAIPFYTEYQSNPALKALVDRLGGVDKIDSNSVSAFVQALLFQDAVEKVVAKGDTLTRQTLFDALKTENAFDGQGIIGPTDVGNHKPTPCFAVAQVINGQWERVYPKEVGKFDCDPGNLAQVKLNMNG